jgi:hypothetical protein
MAMGCVPLVAPDVDMESYANPPVNGVHYLRVETPEEAAAIARAMPKENGKRCRVRAKPGGKPTQVVKDRFNSHKNFVYKV